MSRAWENNEKPNLMPHFDSFCPNLGKTMFFVSFTFSSSKTLFLAIILWNLKEGHWTKLQKIAKHLILDQVLAHLADLGQFGPPVFFREFYLY